ncbi:MAG: hypothetical protein ABIP45_06100 [Knoellia sp.]
MELFRPAYLVVLVVAAALLAPVVLATRLIPADAHEFSDQG